MAEAVLLFGISRDTIYRLVRLGKIPAINLGERLTRISCAHIETMFAPLEVLPTAPEIQPEKMTYSQAECYTIGEITEKFGVSPSTVSNAIRRNSIPKKQVGKFVYVPKEEIDKIFASKK
ncbi:MAG: helix-turn-helix domain-containing protein [Prevotellaceae bacterium]|nr:helix-turn-helix domain-containing protein [Prevotellaceae bacterium]